MAAEVARRLASRGDRIYLIARNVDKLAALVAELGDKVVGFSSADLNRVEDNSALIDAAVDKLGTVDLVLIAHGYLGDQLRSEDQLAEALEILETNLVSVVSLLIPLSKHLARAGAGHIGVITSVAGERGRPRNFTYGAAKGGLSRYLEGLRSCVHPRGVLVHNFKMGPVDTPMTVDHHKGPLFSTPAKVAGIIERGLASRRHVIYVPGFWRWIMLFVRWVPEPIFRRLPFLSGR